MYQGLDHFNKCFQYKYQGSSDQAIFIFHGFPSQKNRNKDIAHALGTKTPHTVLVHHYEGIGESLGSFTFAKSVSNAKKFISHHLNNGKYKKIHFIGHSWGGFISLNMLCSFREITGRIFLLSPFNQIPKNSNLNTLVDALFKEYPHCFYDTNKSSVKKDFQFIQKKYNYLSLMEKKMPTQSFKILQAIDDLAVPEETTRKLVTYLGKNVVYKEIKIDHSFTLERKRTINEIVHYFSKL